MTNLAEINSYFKHLEWEFLQNEFTIDNVIANPNLPKNITRIEVWRDKSYNVKATVFATEEGNSNQDYRTESIPGSFIETFTIKGSTWSQDVELRDCSIVNFNSSWSGIDENDTKKIELDLITSGMKVNVLNNSETAWLTDWYLNGPHNLYLPRQTKRNISLNFKRLRGFVEKGNLEYNNESFESSRDYAYVDTDEAKFLITQIGGGFGPKWSNNVGIEYIEELKSIPEIETRVAISDIVSFTFGKPLLNIGYTKYNIDGNLVEAYVKSPLTDNTISLCQNADKKPINIRTDKAIEFEEVLKRLVPSYLQLNDKLNLKESLYLYWASIDAPIGTNLPILSSALEKLTHNWFKSNKTRTAYMEKNDFDKLFNEELAKISEKLGEVENGDKILKKIKSSIYISSHDRIQYFFNDIHLKIDKKEKSALDSRHSMAHGGIKFDEGSIKNMIQMTQAYQTFFNRIILKILGYEGAYIDRSTLGFPERHIDVPLGGKTTSK